MMYASVRGVDGTVTSLGAIDLTAPNGMGRLAQLAQAAKDGMPEVPGLPAHARQPPQPAMMTAPAPCRFRVPVRTRTGLQWSYVQMPCPPGVPPGLYVRVVQREHGGY